jgi:hypothetical protein
MGRVAAPGARQGELARLALEQLQAQFAFEAADMLRDGALGDAELIGRGAEIEMPCGRLEGAQRVERRQALLRFGHAVVFLSI